MLRVFHFADVDRLAAFDSAVADRALRDFETRLRGAVDAASPVARLRHGGFAAWLRLAGDADGGEARLQAIAYVLSQPFDGGRAAPLAHRLHRRGRLSRRTGGTRPSCCAAPTRSWRAAARPSGLVATVSSQTTAAARDRFSLTQELRGAIARDELHLQFQPVVDAVAGRVAGAEALLRWTSPGPRRSSRPPLSCRFWRRSGLIDEVGLWIAQRRLPPAGRLDHRAARGA